MGECEGREGETRLTKREQGEGKVRKGDIQVRKEDKEGDNKVRKWRKRRGDEEGTRRR